MALLTSAATAQEADLAVAQQPSASKGLCGSSVSYTVTVLNRGPQTATAVRVAKPLPASVSYLNATGEDWSCSEENSAASDNSVVSCDATRELAPGELSTFSVEVAMPSTPEVITSRVTVASAGMDPHPSNNASTSQVKCFVMVPVRVDGSQALIPVHPGLRMVTP